MLYNTYLVIGAVAGIQCGSGQIHTRSFCTQITMPETRLCDDNLPIIEIVQLSQYDFTGDEYPGRPCVYSDIDCGKAIRYGVQLYRDILTHCDGQMSCGGFYIAGLPVCSGRYGDYMTIRFRCIRDETGTTILSPTSIRASSPKPQEATTPPNATPSSVTTGSHVNPPTSSGVTGAESNEPKTDGSTSREPRRDNIVTGLGVGVAAAFVVGVGFGVAAVVVFNRRKRNSHKPIRASPPLDTEGISGLESGAASPQKGGQRLNKTNIREGGGTGAGRVNDDVDYYNVAPTLIHGRAAYSNVDITRVPGREDYSDVDIRMEPTRTTSSDASLQHATHTNLASVGLPANVPGTGGQYADLTGLPANVPGTDGQYADLTGLPANMPDTDEQYADLAGEGPGSSEYEALGPELVVHSSQYVALNNRQ